MQVLTQIFDYGFPILTKIGIKQQILVEFPTIIFFSEVTELFHATRQAINMAKYGVHSLNFPWRMR